MSERPNTEGSSDVYEALKPQAEAPEAAAQDENAPLSELAVELEGEPKSITAAERAFELSKLSESAMQKVQDAFAKKAGAAEIKATAEAYFKDAAANGSTREQAVAALQAKLKDLHDAYFGAGQETKASEIDSFSRSLDQRSAAKTNAGREFLSKLEAGGFSGLEEAMYALEDVKDKALAEGGEADVNAEFNVLFKAINEKFLS